MDQYDHTITLDPGRDFVYVDLGPSNGPSRQPFQIPTTGVSRDHT